MIAVSARKGGLRHTQAGAWFAIAMIVLGVSASILEPFRTPAPSDQASEGAGVSLSLTKALVEANHARFQIKTGARSGTLIEVVFSHAEVKA